jgi:hypothetical protein
MNKRIRELAQEAGMYVDLNGNPWPKSMSAEECEVAYNTFAELIVRECARVYWNIDDGELHTEYVKSLKKHFGVEE